MTSDTMTDGGRRSILEINAIGDDFKTWEKTYEGDADCYSFAAAMYAAPLDQTPRLIYADWLEDRGLHALASAFRDSEFRTWPIEQMARSCWELHHLDRRLGAKAAFEGGRYRKKLMNGVLLTLLADVGRTSMIGVTHALGWQWNTVVATVSRVYVKTNRIEGTGVTAALHGAWEPQGYIELRSTILDSLPPLLGNQ